ncbi:MAG: scyllo-inosose 3-dehydrogenase [Nitrososphaerota archaeon]|nr:scyllo-inosose 3-dehydrogenase [Candidatus Calditenuaceae archaeon]MDW8073752.1 scyllo-inosose 3-dehydrogenase [Nitrososphaerota archaeon]
MTRQIAAVLEADFRPRPGYRLSGEEERTRRVVNGSRVWRAPRVEIREIDLPRPGRGEVLIKLGAVGICGSDLHMVEMDGEGYMLYPGLTRLPVVPGHELSGVVDSVGEGVEDLKPGDLVVVEEMWYCGRCDACRTSYFNQCYGLEEMGFTVNGGMEEYMVAEAKYVWKINGFLDIYGSEEKALEAGSLVEPLCVNYNAIFVRAGNYRPGCNAVVWGAGPIGLGAVALLKASGAAKIIVFEPVDARREMAKRMGATHIFDPVELQSKAVRPYEKIMEVTDGAGADLHVEAAGRPSKILPEVERSLAVGGSVVWIGRADEEASVWLEYFQTHASQIYGSQGHAGNAVWPRVIRMIENGRLDPTPMITARFELENVSGAFQALRERGHIKVTIKP